MSNKEVDISVYKFKIDDIPKSLNHYAGRANSWEYREDKKNWTALVYYNCIGKRPKNPITKALVTITYFFPTQSRRDPDNYSGKMIMDGLVTAGVLEDDSFGCIELRLRGEYDKVEPRTEIVVEVM
ncbi:hypothetical protein GC105_10640 [Alkalibaculum sp. M08DMB]|uniref:Uncharacterized protein n=1 Tax=Alkalibaculum sporogenes TaxID=2655001 RepID=A0A6A7KA57_9FIRM|nr:hypothetical protein [Alkalibaculum sporogenes]MPW26245.1 hypothetical protein [Alkalibaculum sporogenes]